MRLQTPEQTYLNEVFPLNDPDLLRIKQKLMADNLDFMSISGPEARILQFLIRGFKLNNILEIGTLYGYSAVAMALALPPGGRVTTLEMKKENFAIASANVRETAVKNAIDILCGDALAILPTLEARGPFDLVFIDANKAGYLNYLNWAEKNVRKGGLIVGDNTFLFGGVWGQSRDPDVSEKTIAIMKEFNLRLADSRHYNSILVPSLEGMTIAQKI